jgi:hypothetical protein
MKLNYFLIRLTSSQYVIPAEAGIQYFRVFLDSRLRGNDIFTQDSGINEELLNMAVSTIHPSIKKRIKWDRFSDMTKGSHPCPRLFSARSCTSASWKIQPQVGIIG